MPSPWILPFSFHFGAHLCPLDLLDFGFPGPILRALVHVPTQSLQCGEICKKILKCQKVVKNFIPAFKKWHTKLGNGTWIGDRSSLLQVILVHCAEKQTGIESFSFNWLSISWNSSFLLVNITHGIRRRKLGTAYSLLSVLSPSAQTRKTYYFNPCQLWISASEKILFLKTLLY